jgi:hypothetical protein
MGYLMTHKRRGVHTHSMLHEFRTRRELWELTSGEGKSFEQVTARTAHKWVLAGGLHNTSLYIGEDSLGRPRVLKAVVERDR